MPEDDIQASTYVRLAVRSYPELYFARFVILAEGDSERVVLPRLAEARGVPLDPSFVPVVPLGGRYVSHFWRLLTDLGIPHATLLDFDLGRTHGGAKMIRTAFAALEEVDRDLTANPLVIDGTISLDDLEVFDDEMFWRIGRKMTGFRLSDMKPSSFPTPSTWISRCLRRFLRRTSTPIRVDEALGRQQRRLPRKKGWS